MKITNAFLIIAVLCTTLLTSTLFLFIYFVSLSCFLGMTHLVTTRCLTPEQQRESNRI